MVKFSEEAKSLHASDIREILKVTENPEIISFAGGLPAPELFPIDEMMKVDVEILKKEGRQAVQYSTTEGYVPLRKQIAKRMKTSFHTDCTYEDIIITAGSQQGLSLLGQLFLNEGDIVLVESPTYMGATTAFAVNFPNFVEVETDDKGMVPEALEAALEKYGDRVRLMYVIPEFQNPTGITWPVGRRKAFMDLINQYDFPVLEDDPYGELRFEGEHLPPIAKLAPNNTVLLGSFSKTVVPAFRLGWMLVPDWLRKKVTIAKQATDLHSNAFSQQVLHRFLIDNSLDAHLEKIKEVYGRQRAAMEAALARHCPPGVSYTRPEGGMFLWLTLPASVSAMALFDEAIKEKVAFVPGAPFYVRPEIQNTLRLSFSCVDEATIEEGVKRLCRALARML